MTFLPMIHRVPYFLASSERARTVSHKSLPEFDIVGATCIQSCLVPIVSMVLMRKFCQFLHDHYCVRGSIFLHRENRGDPFFLLQWVRYDATALLHLQ